MSNETLYLFVAHGGEEATDCCCHCCGNCAHAIYVLFHASYRNRSTSTVPPPMYFLAKNEPC